MWWLTNPRALLLLAFMAHRTNKDLTNNCTGHDSGATRAQLKENQSRRREEERAAERNESAAALMHVRNSDPDHIRRMQLKEDMVKAAITESRNKSIEAHMNTDRGHSEHIQLQISILRENKDSIIFMEGEDAYHKKIGRLITELQVPSRSSYFFSNDGETSQNQNEEEEDEHEESEDVVVDNTEEV